MTEVTDKVRTIEEWLRSEMEAANGSAVSQFDRDAVVFSFSSPGGPRFGEIEISREAIEDYSVHEILADLGRQDVPVRLRRDPTMRLAYNTEREVPHFETRVVRCDGRQYRFVRDSEHAVRVYDAADRMLAATPSPLPVLMASLFKRSPQQLCEDVRAWRGPNQ